MKKRMLPLFLCFVFLLSACAGPSTDGNTAAPEPVQEPTAELNVYLADPFYENYLDLAVRKFRQSHPEVTLNVTAVQMGTEEEGQKLPAELAAGRGPDLYIGKGREFKDLYKVLNTGAFCDITPYLERLEGFDRTRYIEEILDGGIYQGKQLFLPLTWYYPAIITTQEALDEAGISVEELRTFSGLMRAAQKYSAAHGGAFAFFEKYARIDFLMYADGLRPDYEALQMNVDTAEFREMIDAYKLIYAQDQSSRDYDQGVFYGESEYSLRNRNHLFTNGYGSGYLGPSFPFPFGLGAEFSFLTGEETPLLLPVPTVDGKTLARINLFAAINTNSPNKANAADFIALLLQKDLQDQIGKFESPVCLELYDVRIKGLRHLDCAGSGSADDAGNPLATYANLSEEDTDRLLGALLKIDGVVRLTDPRSAGPVLQIIYDDMRPYWEDEQSYETCLQKLQSDLTIYISE